MAGARLRTGTTCLLLLLAGCGLPELSPAGGAPSPTPAAETSTSATPTQATPVDRERARRDVRRAVLDLLHAGTGRATTVLAFGSQQVRDEVRYDLARGFTVRREFVGPGRKVLALDAVVVGRELWYQLTGRGRGTCYIHTTVDQLPGLSTETIAMTLPRLYPHAALNVVGTVRGTATDAGSASLGTYLGNVRLIAVVELLGARALERFGIDRRSKDRVGVTVRLTGGTLTSIRIAGHDFVTALLEADVDEPKLEEGAGAMQFMLSFSQPGSAVVLAPPPAREVVELSLDGDFDAEMADCVRRHR